MNIAVFTDAYRPEINGVTTSIYLFRKELERRGHRVYLFCPEYNRNPDDDPAIVRLPSIPYFFKQMRERRFVFPSLRKLWKIRHLGIDVIHSHVPGNTGVFALLASWLFRIPHVHTYHTLYMEYIHYVTLPQAFATRAVLWITRHFCGRCQRVVAPSNQITEVLRSYSVDAPIDVIPTGIDTMPPDRLASRETIRERFGLRPGDKLLSFVGRIGREKSIDFLLHVVNAMRTERDDFKLVIVGDGPDRAGLEELRDRLGLQNRVIFTGYQSRETVFSVYRASDAFVFSSQTETQGLVLLEAMSMGTPVVAVNAMGVADLEGDGRGGFLTDPTVEDFSRHLAPLLDDPKLQERKSAEALEKAAEWSLEAMTTRLLETYRCAIADYRVHGLPRFRRRFPAVCSPVASTR
jgi:glycosyltransferase involved in cell wall biosynthesis